MLSVGLESESFFFFVAEAFYTVLCACSWGIPSTHGETTATEATMLILLAATGLAVDSSTSLSSFSSALKRSVQ